MPPEFNKADMTGMMEPIKEYLRLHYGDIRAPLVYIIRKAILVEIHGDDCTYMTPDDEMIANMQHLPPETNKLHNKKIAQPVKDNMAEFKLDSRSVHYILDQICKDIDLDPYVKQHKSKMDRRRAILSHPFQTAKPEQCECNSIRIADVDIKQRKECMEL